MTAMSGYTPNGPQGNGPQGNDPYGLTPQGSGGYESAPGGYESPTGGFDGGGQFGQGYGGGYAGQAAPPPQPQPQPSPYQQGFQGPPGYGQQPPYGGFGVPQQKKSSTGLALGIVGGIVALLLIGGVGGFFLIKNNRPDQTVLDYFAALQAGDADKALSLARQRPSDLSLLTDEVLKASNELGAITDVQVNGRTDRSVRVSYRLDGSQTYATINVTKVSGDWKLRDVAFPVGMMSAEDGSLFLNGIEVKKGAVAFPGLYEVGTGSKHLEWSQETVTVRPDETANVMPLSLSISDDGEQAARDAIRAKWDSCMKKKELQPKGCPFQMKLNGTVNSDTIRWSADPHPADTWVMMPLTDPTKVSGPAAYGLRLSFDYTAGGESYHYDKNVPLRLSIYFDFTQEELEVHWET